MSTVRHVALFAILAISAVSRPIFAIPPLAAAARRLPPQTSERLLGGRSRVDVLMVRPGGVTVITTVPVEALQSMLGGSSEISVGAVRRPLLDQSVSFIHADAVRHDRGLTGMGVAVAVVDTGVDVRHRDLRNADGTTRIAWLLDLSRPARGVHADLEQAFGLMHDDGNRYGAVYSADDLNALLSHEQTPGQPSPDIPTDEVGHGTYVASIAAGNGLATSNGQPNSRFVGVAPNATLIVVRATAMDSDRFTDAAIVDGVSFAMDRATALAVPVVVNLSLGSHYGSHDGSSALERALVALLPADVPSRAIVVAAGNEGETAIHARVDIIDQFPGEIRLNLASGAPGDLTVIEVAYEGTASIAVRFPDHETTAWVNQNEARGFATSSGVVSIANATDMTDTNGTASLTPGATVRTASIVFAGDADHGVQRGAGEYSILVHGSGAVHAYVADPGDAVPTAEFGGGAISWGTVAVPATSLDLVSVGALATRFTWSVGANQMARAVTTDTLGTVASFSSRGPNRINQMVPTLVAPGEFIIAAMSAQLESSQLAFALRNQLIEADGVHMAGRGSSAAAPHVAGAMAQLLQAHPLSSQADLASALASSAVEVMSGSARWNESEGWGAIRVDRALDELDAMNTPGLPDHARSEVSVSIATVAVNEPVTVSVRLRDALSNPVRDAHNVALTATEGALGSVVAIGGGRYEATWRAQNVGAGTRALLSATVDGVALDQTATVLVVTDVANGTSGLTATGGCGVSRSTHSSTRICWFWAGYLAIFATQRRRRHAS